MKSWYRELGKINIHIEVTKTIAIAIEVIEKTTNVLKET